MKYLVNRETKEHRPHRPGNMADEQFFGIFGNEWKIVEADSEGWIPWSRGKCPLPGGMPCQVRLECDSEKRTGFSDIWQWDAPSMGRQGIIAYRPILTEQSEPEMPFGDKNLWIEESGQIEQSVFYRLASAVSASESIPALIAEINAMLPEGYMVARIGVDMARGADLTAEPVEDMRDWRNWRDGDILECLDGNGWAFLKTGEKYPFDKAGDGKGPHVTLANVRDYPGDFRFHSRLTGASK